MITDKLVIETDRLEISCKTPRISDEQELKGFFLIF